MTTLPAIEDMAAAEGLAVAGAFHPGAEDGAPASAGTLVLLGPAFPGMWQRFSSSPECRDGAADPLDRWSARVVAGLASALGGAALFPFGGPPHAPFPRWAALAESARPSPVGMLVSPRRGLWMSYRGALALPARLDLAQCDTADPCLDCPAPCLSACPVSALGADGYDLRACVRHVEGASGGACRETGCLVRRACPAGTGVAPPDAQSRFHMRAFLRAHARLASG